MLCLFSQLVCVSFCLQVKAATGEEVSAEDLGGADLHCKYEIKVFLTGQCLFLKKKRYDINMNTDILSSVTGFIRINEFTMTKYNNCTLCTLL